MKKATDTICEICGAPDCETIYKTENDNLARYGLLDNVEGLDDLPQLKQNVAYCANCNYAWNLVFDPANVVYKSNSIIEAGRFSPRYMEYQQDAASKLDRSINQSVELAIEIGAGAGIFLNMINATKKVAFEPSDEAKFIDPSIEVINDYFSEKEIKEHINLVILRQVLEHIASPQAFLKNVIRACARVPERDFYLYIEVPNAERTFDNGRFCDFYYEHCNHFTLKSILNIATNLDLEAVESRLEMDGELTCVLLKRAKATDNSSEQISKRLSHTEYRLNRTVDTFKGKSILAWGACGNGTVALNKLNLTTDIIPVVIDSDKNKQGKYIPGTKQKIISPDDAREYNPSLIIVFSQLHKTEIMKECQRIFGEAPLIEVI